MEKIYLASPYTHRDPAIKEKRFIEVCKEVGKLMGLGYIVFSPIAHCHPVAMVSDLPGDWDYWKELCIEFVKWADEIWILMLPDWEKSVGIKNEIVIAEKLGKKVRHIMNGDRHV